MLIPKVQALVSIEAAPEPAVGIHRMVRFAIMRQVGDSYLARVILTHVIPAFPCAGDIRLLRGDSVAKLISAYINTTQFEIVNFDNIVDD